MRLKPLDQQVVVVFGASSGIGRETAARLAEKGAKVVVSARSGDSLDSLVDEIRAKGGTAHAVAAEAADFAQVKSVADEAVRLYGRIDTWVHAAGVLMFATFEQTTPDEFKRIVDVNLLGQVYGAKAALPYLIEGGGGALIHISSVEAMRATPYHAAYAASKHGIHGFLQALRLELIHDKRPVCITEIMPPAINTPLFRKSRTKIGFQPMGLPPIYPPRLVSDAILHAAEHPTREIVLGGAGKGMLLTQRLSPRLMDALMLAVGFRGQRTREPKPEAAPDNLFAPLPGQNTVEGEFGHLARLEGTAPWLERNKWLVTGAAAALGAAALLARRRGGSGDENNKHR